MGARARRRGGGRAGEGRVRARAGADVDATALTLGGLSRAVDLLNIDEAERLARERLPAPVYGYYAGGAEDETTLRANVEAWRRWSVVHRALVDVRDRDLRTTALGRPVDLPFAVAPTAFHRLAHADAEVATAKAARAKGALFCLSSLSTTSLEDVSMALAPGGASEASVPRAPKWFQLYLYKDRATGAAMAQRAEKAGYDAIALTVDTPVLGRRERDAKLGFQTDVRPANFAAAVKPAASGAAMLRDIFGGLDDGLTWKDLDWLRGQTSLPILVKGVVHPDDARLAVEHGAAGIIVSNHGGRQLDGSIATADALPDVVAAVDGRAEVWVDGGIRRGVDVLRALALGAQGVLVGRPALWGLAVGGQAGVEAVLECLRRELDVAMALAGARNVKDARNITLRRS